jgi:RNA polymerase sigma-70 factor, ECF subfamily
VLTPDLTLALPEEIGDNTVGPCDGTLIGAWTRVAEDNGTGPFPGSVDMSALAGLLERGKAGDMSALEAIYEAHKTRIYQLAYRHTYNPVIAEDLLQDIFIKVFAHLGDVRDPATFPAWLYRVALNTCYSYLRGRKLRSEMMVPLSEVEGRLSEATYDDHETDLRKPIEEAVQTLPAKLRRIFVLHDIEGFKHGEIAGMLGCSVGTSKSQLFKARIKVRNILKRRGIGKEKES